MSGEPGTHKWYIEPDDTWTNEVLGKNQEFLSDDGIFDGVKCVDGKPHKLWRCKDYAFVAQLCKSRGQLKIKFKVWHQEGNGQIRLWGFVQKNRRRR